MGGSNTSREFEELFSGNTNQPILIDTPSSLVAKQMIHRLTAEFNLIELNEYDGVESIKIDQIRDLASLASNSGTARVNLIVIYNFETQG